jgi:carbamoyltransferase
LESIANRTISEDRFIQVNHHLAHAAGAFYSSDFGESLILTLDGYGEEESSIWAVGVGNRIDVRGTVLLPVSLGLLYQVVTAYLGFRSFGDEYKVMGLASYGDCRKYRNVFDQLVISSSDGTYRIETLSRIDLLSWLREAFGDHAAHQGFSMKTADIAAALQAVLEKTILAQLSFLKKECGASSLCLSGGVALNACMNSAILRSGLFRKTFIQPAAGDDGASLGAALYTYHDILCHERSKPLRHVNWGPAYGSDAILSVLRTAPNVRYWKENDIEDVAARLLSEGKTVGWFQGRMEMGPRALGGRSILADPRSVDLRDRLNVSIKSREFFRPFAPSVLQECAAQFFEVPPDSSFPFMLITFATRREMQHVIPGVVHVDGSARIQTVSQEDHPRFYRLLQKFHSYTGIPLLLNTSFNRAGEPIVCSPRDALQCFLKSGLNVLVMEDFLILNDGGDL